MAAIVKALRKSITGEKDSSKISIAPKSAVAIVHLKKVRRLRQPEVHLLQMQIWVLTCPSSTGHPRPLRL